MAVGSTTSPPAPRDTTVRRAPCTLSGNRGKKSSSVTRDSGHLLMISNEAS